MIVEDFQGFDPLEISAVRGLHVGVDKFTVGKFHIARGEGPAVMPSYVFAQMEDYDKAALLYFPTFGQFAFQI